MIVHYWLLSFALLLLWFPRQGLRVGNRIGPRPRRKRPSDQLKMPGDMSVGLSEEITKVRNWIDFLRSIAGSIAVMKVCFEIAPNAPKDTAQTILVIQLALLAVGMLAQTYRLEEGLKLFPPLFYALGLSFGVLGLQPALFAIVALLAINLVLPSPAVFLTVFAGLELCFGLFLKVPMIAAVGSGVLTLLPVFLSVAMKRRLVHFNKKAKGAS